MEREKKWVAEKMRRDNGQRVEMKKVKGKKRKIENMRKNQDEDDKLLLNY